MLPTSYSDISTCRRVFSISVASSCFPCFAISIISCIIPMRLWYGGGVPLFLSEFLDLSIKEARMSPRSFDGVRLHPELWGLAPASCPAAFVCFAPIFGYRVWRWKRPSRAVILSKWVHINQEQQLLKYFTLQRQLRNRWKLLENCGLKSIFAAPLGSTRSPHTCHLTPDVIWKRFYVTKR